MLYLQYDLCIQPQSDGSMAAFLDVLYSPPSHHSFRKPIRESVKIANGTHYGWTQPQTSFLVMSHISVKHMDPPHFELCSRFFLFPFFEVLKKVKIHPKTTTKPKIYKVLEVIILKYCFN